MQTDEALELLRTIRLSRRAPVKKTKTYSKAKNQNTKQMVLRIAIIALMTGLNTVVTMVFAVYLPVSRGYFNIGESMVYLTAILFGPYIGAISAGVGAMLADIFIGLPIYAPGTLVVKGVEALIVGFLFQKFQQMKSQNAGNKKNTKNLLLILVVAIVISAGILCIGFIFYIGPAEVSGFKELYIFNTNFTYLFWSIIAGVAFLGIIGIYIFLDTAIALKVISMLSGGIFMVLGYLMYGTFILTFFGEAIVAVKVGFLAAASEIPFNILQVCLGIAIAVPISGPIKNTLKL